MFNKIPIFSLFILTALISLRCSLWGSISEKEAEEIGIEVYIYGYPLVTMEKTREVMTNVEKPIDHKAPMGQFSNARSYPDPAFHDVTAPNADTLYSTAWLDLSQEPYIFKIPDEKGRYFLMPLLSGWTEVVDVPGTRTTGTGAQEYILTGPGYQGKIHSGEIPAGVKEIKFRTHLVWILGRTYCTGTPEDYQAVHALQDQYTLIPLSSYGKTYTPPKGTVNPKIDMKTPVRDQVNRMKMGDFLKTLAHLMIKNPPSIEDYSIVAKMAKIGVIPGQEFEIKNIDPKVAKGLESAPEEALKKMGAYQKNSGQLENGWYFSLKTGNYGSDYLQRAFIAMIGLGANRPEDAVYPVASQDSQGSVLTGKNKYVIHFPKGQTPPAKAFWSITMYNEQLFFVENPLNRYSISPRNKLSENPDGSLDIYIQNESPATSLGKDKESNWLPAPKGKFILMMRIYWPEKSLLNGTWKPPGVEKIE